MHDSINNVINAIVEVRICFHDVSIKTSQEHTIWKSGGWISSSTFDSFDKEDQKYKNMKHSQDMQLIQKLRDDQKHMKKVFKVMSGRNIVTNSRVTPSWREIVSLTFSEAGVLHVNWISFGHCVSTSKENKAGGTICNPFSCGRHLEGRLLALLLVKLAILTVIGIRDKMPRATTTDISLTKSYIPKVSKIPGISPTIAKFYKSIENRNIHEGRVVDQAYYKSNNIERLFTNIRFDCLFKINEPIVPRFILDFYSQVTVQTDEYGYLFISFMIQHEFITLTLAQFGEILKIPYNGQAVFTNEWDLASLEYS
ncbi:hypothetical protein Tco_0680269 [Tanacetum coccineum]|uniref:Uncharacterized protein n=1 Tax=Tanacetum coccineum TaxID=301880 RepID=A0ABQ4XKX8_9ASTR